MEMKHLTEKNHKRDQMTSEATPSEASSGIPPHRNHQHAVGGHKDPPGGVVQGVGVMFSGLKIKVSVVAGEETG